MPINSFSSHRLENLAEELKCNMRNSSAMRQVIIVPGADVKEWITRNFVKQWGVAFGFKVLDLSSAVDYFSRLSDEGQRRGVPSRSLFALYLSVLLERNGKIAHVSDRLAKLFLSYGKYGGSWLESWKRGGGWQQELWKEVESDWAFPKLSKAPEITHEIHLFALPDMPSLYADYFEKLGEHWKIHLYHFSPCGEYWEDILSEKGAFRLDEIYKKEGVKEEEREVFRNIASDVPFLLAIYGKLGR
ncbi:MAG: exodeoxyribonuclease V subunit gamma, partial [Simkaniaceae bacterium]|nr:exodeoxyribonuclease V subunit gamma [Simkaniaceae bacterium]